MFFQFFRQSQSCWSFNKIIEKSILNSTIHFLYNLIIINTFLFKKCSKDELNDVWNENEIHLKNDIKNIDLKRDDEMKKTVETNLWNCESIDIKTFFILTSRSFRCFIDVIMNAILFFKKSFSLFSILTLCSYYFLKFSIIKTFNELFKLNIYWFKIDMIVWTYKFKFRSLFSKRERTLITNEA